MPRIQRLLMSLVLILGLYGCDPICSDTCKQKGQQCLELNDLLIQKLKVQEQQFNTWAQSIYSNRDYKERQASIVKGCDVLIPVCTKNMTKEGRELISLGFGGLDQWQVWVILLIKLAVLIGMMFVLLWFGFRQVDKLINNHHSALDDIKHKREELALVEAEIEQQRQSINHSKSSLSWELANTQTEIATNRQTLEQLKAQKQAILDEIELTKVQHGELKMQVDLMEAVTRGLR